MSTLKISSYARQGYTVFFTLFLFFSAVFCVSTRTNNLLHLSILLFLLSLLNHDNRQALAESIRQRWLVYILLVVFCVYYALSNIWGQTPQHIDSPLTHGAYLFFYLLLLTTLLGDPRTRHLALLSVVAGITVLSIWTMAIDFTLVLKERLVSPGNPGPTNVIDLAGYCGIGILICAMLLKEKGSHLLYVPMAIMLVMLFLTQSRGPIIALLAAFVCTLHLHVFTRRNVLIVAALALVLGALFFFTPTGDLLLARFEELGTQSGLRLSIWRHTLQEVASQPWLGRGFDYELNFTNYSGEHITILSTLPTAGVGALLALMIAGSELDVIAIIGIILLIGIVKKNAIMMIDFALAAEREQGMSPREAIYQACLLRFRPILMTTLAALLGALPLMLSTGVGAELRRPLGIGMVGGLIVSQVLTLFTTPVIYLLFDRLALWTKSRFARHEEEA